MRLPTARATAARSLLALACAALVAGCTGGAPAAQPSLVVPTGDGPVTCQEHQSAPPGTDYAGGAEADTAKVFTLLRYWKEHGDKPFCDGEGPNDADGAWAALVDRLLDDEPAPASEPAPTTT